MLNIQDTFFGSKIKNDFLSPIIVCFVLIPEAVLFSIIAGVSPMVGLYTAIILGITTAILGGKAGLISGPSAAIAIILAALGYHIKDTIPEAIFQTLLTNNEVSIYILQHILLATIFAGIIQLFIGFLKLSKFIRVIPLYMIFGLVNGLAVLIITTQLYLFKGESYTMYLLFAATLCILYFAPRYIKFVPPTLIALLILSLLSYFFALDTKKIGDIVNLSTQLPHFSIPTINLTWNTFISILPYSALIAFVGLLQSMITLCMVDEMGEKRGSENQECIAQGAGNIACGFFGAMAGSTMLSQSIINFKNGATGRLSSLLVVVLLSVCLIHFSAYIIYVPLAVLLGILFMISFNLFQWQNMKRIKYMSRLEKFLLLVITAITILTELHIAFLISTGIVFMLYALKQLRIKSKIHMSDDETRIYEFDGPLFFKNTQAFKTLIDIQHDPKNVIMDFKHARIVDQYALDCIDEIAQEYKELRTNLRIRYLSKDCKNRLSTAKAYCEYCEDEPHYKVAVDY